MIIQIANFFHPKRLRTNIQSQNLMSCQVYKEDTSICANNVRKNYAPRMNSFDISPFGHTQQPHIPTINQNNEIDLNDHTPTFSQIVERNIAPKMDTNDHSIFL